MTKTTKLAGKFGKCVKHQPVGRLILSANHLFYSVVGCKLPYKEGCGFDPRGSLPGVHVKGTGSSVSRCVRVRITVCLCLSMGPLQFLSKTLR